VCWIWTSCALDFACFVVSGSVGLCCFPCLCAPWFTQPLSLGLTLAESLACACQLRALSLSLLWLAALLLQLLELLFLYLFSGLDTFVWEAVGTQLFFTLLRQLLRKMSGMWPRAVARGLHTSTPVFSLPHGRANSPTLRTIKNIILPSAPYLLAYASQVLCGCEACPLRDTACFCSVTSGAH
jgi:hypothetical protein